MPPRPSRPPARLPGRLVGQRWLPQHEIERVSLVRILRMTPMLGGQFQHLGAPVAAQPPETGEAGHAEVDGAPRLVGMTALERDPDEGQDLGDGRRRPRLRVHGEEVEQPHLGVEARHLLRGQVEVVHPELAGLAENVVVDVGDVAHAPGGVPSVAEAALEHVEDEIHRGMAQVRGVVGRDAAGVHGHLGARFEGHHRPSGRVEEPHEPPSRLSDRPRSRPCAASSEPDSACSA